jgi:hypothetical protein
LHPVLPTPHARRAFACSRFLYVFGSSDTSLSFVACGHRQGQFFIACGAMELMVAPSAESIIQHFSENASLARGFGQWLRLLPPPRPRPPLSSPLSRLLPPPRPRPPLRSPPPPRWAAPSARSAKLVRRPPPPLKPSKGGAVSRLCGPTSAATAATCDAGGGRAGPLAACVGRRAPPPPRRATPGAEGRGR